ncbi:MAG: hypothetical protein EXQ93_04420 [Alphaproteobacteria bacterium]|nr:hypothetical protein [Alphaproteobacteria bacterium]
MIARTGALGALLLLGACVVEPLPAPAPPVAALRPAAPVQTAPQAPVIPAPEPVPAPPQVAVALPPPPPAVAVPKPPQTLNPPDLIGRARTDVIALLGAPDTARTEAGAEVLLYQGTSCTLFVFVYEPVGGGAARAEHVEVGPRTRDVSRDPACLTGLLQRVAAN